MSVETRLLSGAAIAVLAGDREVGRELAAGLAALGASMTEVDATPDADAAGLVDGVVVAPFRKLRTAKIADVDEAGWEGGCETVIKEALASAQLAFGVLKAGGGRVVFLVPTEGMTGGAGRVAEATAGEAVRSLAKSAARAWGGDRITANCVAVPLPVLSGESPPAPPAGWSLGRPPSWADIISAVAMLLSPAAAFVTGTTLTVDGGDVMTP